MKSLHRAKANVCFSKHRAPSEIGVGVFMRTTGPQARGRRPEDQGPQQISESRFIHTVNEASSERNLRWWEERNVEARSEATLRVNERWRAKDGPQRETLSFTYALYTKVWNLIDGTTS